MRKIRIFPTQDQQVTLKRWIGAARWTYNRTVHYLNQESTKGSRTLKDLRAHSVNAEALKSLNRHDLERVPYDIRDEGVRDARKALASNVAKQRLRKAKGLTLHFKLRYKCKKRLAQEGVVVHSKHWAHGKGAMFDLFGRLGSKLKSAEHLPENLGYDCRLVRTRLNQYWICIPQRQDEVLDETQVPDDTEPAVAALDPGVRTFMTVYDPSGLVCEWGAGDMTRIHRLCRTVDSLRTRWKYVRHRRRYRMKRAALRIHQKIRNLVDELHRKLIKWLATHYRCVLIPVFETQQMVKRKRGRQMHSKTARALCSWSHFRFRTNLHCKAKIAPWLEVIDTTEEVTSKTCGACGFIHAKLAGRKLFQCPNCSFEADRDVNGSRNILIRHLTRACL